VVGDVGSISKEVYGIPDNPRFVYLSVSDQMELFPTLSEVIPWNHYGRKNIGYIYAIKSGAKRIWDFDDDTLGVVNINGTLPPNTIYTIIAYRIYIIDTIITYIN